MNEAAISLAGLAKKYGDRTALSSVDLVVPTGSFSASLGPNGAGKTTLIRCLTGRPCWWEGRLRSRAPSTT